MSLQLEWQYLQRTVPRVGNIVGPIEEAQREIFFPTLFGGEEINAGLRKIIGHSVKHGGLGIPDPWLSEDIAYNTSVVASEELVYYLLGGTSLNYVGHRACIQGVSVGVRKERKHLETTDLDR